MINNSDLPGGSVLNSSLLSLEDTEQISAFNSTYKNFQLKSGIVTQVYDDDDERNISKLGPEYDVLVIEQNENRDISAIQYKNCATMDMFGNVADFFEFRYRKQTKQEGDDGRDPRKQNGAIVLMLCLDGASEKGIIVGALRHPSRKEELTKDKGLHLHGEYNGLNIQVDKDGAFKIEFKGPRDNDGNYTNEEAGGSYLEIDKDGQIDLNTGNEDYVRIDKKNKDVLLRAGNNVGVTAEKDVSIDSGSNLQVKAAKDCKMSIEGKANVNVKSSLDFSTDGALTVKAASVKVTSDGNYQLMAGRIILDGTTFAGGAGGTPAVTLNTQVIGTGNLGAPTVGSMMGPFSSKVFISS